MKLAARLGQGRGHLRVIDRLAHVPRAPRKPDLSNWESHELAAIWIGHATVLLRIGGKTILTDPVFSARVGLGFGIATAGPLRLVRPALSIDELPPIDVILISHAHFDHLDVPSLARLSKTSTVIAPNHVSDLITRLRFRRVIELKLGENITIDPLTITARPVKHWGARTFTDTHRGYCAYTLDAGGKRILYGADTAYQEDWKGLDPVDLAIIGIGAYDPYIAAHANPEQAWEMAKHVQARHVFPIHHSTFKLSHEPKHEPMQRLLKEAGADANRIVVRDVGDQWSL